MVVIATLKANAIRYWAYLAALKNHLIHRLIFLLPADKRNKRLQLVAIASLLQRMPTQLLWMRPNKVAFGCQLHIKSLVVATELIAGRHCYQSICANSYQTTKYKSPISRRVPYSRQTQTH